MQLDVATALVPLVESSSGDMAIPPLFLALGIGAIVVMTIAWFFLKQRSSGSD